MNFIKSKLNHSRVKTKPHKNEIFIFRYNTFHPFIFTNILKNVKEKYIFHSTGNQHFNI
jgi:hypothetical protein